LFSWMRFIDIRKLNKMCFSHLWRKEPSLCNISLQNFDCRIGATTENPSFQVTAPLLSRCRVFVLSPLTRDHILQILKRADAALCEDKGVDGIISDEVINYLADLADGDGTPLSPMANESEECIKHV
jgi:hypothetical protein